MHKLILAMLLSTTVPMNAIAQSDTINSNNMSTTNQTSTTPGSGQAFFVTYAKNGAWRVRDLQGKPVYGSEGENIGQINDVLVSPDGSVNAVVIGVGGFLGLGVKDVAVAMHALQIGPGDTPGIDPQGTGMSASEVPAVSPPSSASGTPRSTMAPATTDQIAPTAPGKRSASDVQTGADGLPDRIIVNVSRQELEAAPAYDENR